MVSELYRSREREKFSAMFRNALTDKGYYDIDIAILNKSARISFACDAIPDTNCLFYHSAFEGDYPANIKDILIRNKEDYYRVHIHSEIKDNAGYVERFNQMLSLYIALLKLDKNKVT